MQYIHTLWTKVIQQVTKARFHTRINKLLTGRRGDAHLNASRAETRSTLYSRRKGPESPQGRRWQHLAAEDSQAFSKYQMNTDQSFRVSVCGVAVSLKIRTYVDFHLIPLLDSSYRGKDTGVK